MGEHGNNIWLILACMLTLVQLKTLVLNNYESNQTNTFVVSKIECSPPPFNIIVQV
jgi:hypothetical protein